MPHIDPLPREEAIALAPEIQELESRLGMTPNSVLTMAHKPQIVRAFVELSRAVLGQGEVPPGLKQLVALVASTAAGCRYCQAHTATFAHDRGVDEAKLESVWNFEESPLFEDGERAALALARDAAQVPNAATATHFADLRQHFSDEEIVELVAVIAFFGWLNRWNDTMATELEGRPWEQAERFLGPGGWTVDKHGNPDAQETG